MKKSTLYSILGVLSLSAIKNNRTGNQNYDYIKFDMLVTKNDEEELINKIIFKTPQHQKDYVRRITFKGTTLKHMYFYHLRKLNSVIIDGSRSEKILYGLEHLSDLRELKCKVSLFGKQVIDLSVLEQMTKLQEIDIEISYYGEIPIEDAIIFPKDLSNLRLLDELKIKAPFRDDSNLDFIGTIPYLKELEIGQSMSYNGEKCLIIPNTINKLISLKKLNIYDASILPKSIYKLQNLETMWIDKSYGPKSKDDESLGLKLPEDIGELTKLRKFSLTNSWVLELPKSFGNLDIQQLTIRNSYIDKIHESLGKIRKGRYLGLEIGLREELDSPSVDEMIYWMSRGFNPEIAEAFIPYLKSEDPSIRRF